MKKETQGNKFKFLKRPALPAVLLTQGIFGEESVLHIKQNGMNEFDEVCPIHKVWTPRTGHFFVNSLDNFIDNACTTLTSQHQFFSKKIE